MKRLGLALGGGGLKGFAHIGVLQILQDNRIPVNFISGTSAGSIIAALMAAGISAYQMEKIILGLKKGDYLDYNVSGLLKYLVSLVIPGFKCSLDGIITGNKIERLMYKLTKGKSLDNAGMPIAIIACDIDTGREIVFTNQRIEIESPEIVIVEHTLLSEAVRASISIPATFVPKHLAGMQMVDGGVKDIVPVMVQKAMGAEYILAVNLGREIYDKKVVGIPQIAVRTIDIMTYETSDTSQEIFADLVINPAVDPVKLDDMEMAPIIIKAGRKAMREKIGLLRSALHAK